MEEEKKSKEEKKGNRGTVVQGRQCLRQKDKDVIMLGTFWPVFVDSFLF